MQRILFLYSELAGYVTSSIAALMRDSKVDAICVVHWPVNQEAPFDLAQSGVSHVLVPKPIYRKNLLEVIQTFRPTAMVVSGWMDADYMHCARLYKSSIPVIVALDNWWTGGFRQTILSWTSKWFIHKHFNGAWVPGSPQELYALQLGFGKDAIGKGFYCADREIFSPLYTSRHLGYNRRNHKQLLYIGRYIKIKGVLELWKSFAELSPEFPDWELHCIGTGELWEERMEHPKIRHHGFIQPSALGSIVIESDGFVLPSHFEPWGVVLHEMSLAGLPILSSEKVGSATAFLRDGINGYSFRPETLKSALQQFMSLTEDEREKMSKVSHNLGEQWNYSKWTLELLELIERLKKSV
jgi:glycosyltransferase involved in cell wall biosynthesis